MLFTNSRLDPVTRISIMALRCERSGVGKSLVYRHFKAGIPSTYLVPGIPFTQGWTTGPNWLAILRFRRTRRETKPVRQLPPLQFSPLDDRAVLAGIHLPVPDTSTPM